MATSWSAYRPLVARHLSQCPVFEIDEAVREAARRFCRESHAWRVRRAALLTTVADQGDYTYAGLPDGAALWRVHEAWDGSTEIAVALPGEDDDASPDETSETYVITALQPDTLRLSPAPQSGDVEVVGSLSFVLNDEATETPDEFDEWRRGIASGAVAELAAQPDRPWSSLGIVLLHQNAFDEAVRQASLRAGSVRRRPLRVKPPPF